MIFAKMSGKKAISAKAKIIPIAYSANGKRSVKNGDDHAPTSANIVDGDGSVIRVKIIIFVPALTTEPVASTCSLG